MPDPADTDRPATPDPVPPAAPPAHNPWAVPWEHARRRTERRLAAVEIVGFAIASLVLAKLGLENGSPWFAAFAVLFGGAACWVSARLAARRSQNDEPLPPDHAPTGHPAPRAQQPGDAFPMWILWTVGAIFLFGIALLVTFGLVYGGG